MYDSKIKSVLEIPIRLEDSVGADITGKTNANLTVLKADPSDTSWVAVGEGNRSLVELGAGDYTLKIVKTLIDERGFFRTKVSCTGAVTKQYVANIVPVDFNVYFKSTGDDSTGDGTFAKPYKSLAQCKTHINSRPGFTIHCLSDAANVAGNKDQTLAFPVKIKGNGFSWATAAPVSYNIQATSAAVNIILENLDTVKIDIDAGSRFVKMLKCTNVTFPTRAFSIEGQYEDCVFSAAIAGGGSSFGNRSKWIRCIFKENVDINITLAGGIFKDCVFEKNLDTGISQFTVFYNPVIHGVLTGPNNGAGAGQVIFKNPYVNNNATLNGKKYVLMGGIIRGALTLETNSIDCVVWLTRIKDGLTDGGTTNEVINKAAWAIPADKMDLLDTLKHKAGASGYVRTTDSLEAIGEKAQDIINKAKMKDIFLNRNVTQRHPSGPGEDKPKTILIGAAGAEGTVQTTIDSDGNLVTEVLS